MAQLGERTITQAQLDFLRSIDMENETALDDARNALEAVTFLAGECEGQLELTGAALRAMLHLILEKLTTIKIGVHLRDI